MVTVQPEERNMYDQHLLSSILREKYPLFILFLWCLGVELDFLSYIGTKQRVVVLP